MKGVRDYEAHNFLRHLITLDVQSGQLLRQPRQDDLGGLGTPGHHGLFRKGLDDISGPGFAHARSEWTSRLSCEQRTL